MVPLYGVYEVGFESRLSGEPVYRTFSVRQLWAMAIVQAALNQPFALIRGWNEERVSVFCDCATGHFNALLL